MRRRGLGKGGDKVGGRGLGKGRDEEEGVR